SRFEAGAGRRRAEHGWAWDAFFRMRASVRTPPPGAPRAVPAAALGIVDGGFCPPRSPASPRPRLRAPRTGPRPPVPAAQRYLVELNVIVPSLRPPPPTPLPAPDLAALFQLSPAPCPPPLILELSTGR